MPLSTQDKITETIQIYFDGLYKSDSELLKSVFHTNCTICGYGSDDGLNIMPLETFLSFVDTVPSPEADGVEYDMNILSIDHAGSIAAVKVHDLYLGRDFIDYLHLIEVDENWLIISKAFHSDLRV